MTKEKMEEIKELAERFRNLVDSFIKSDEIVRTINFKECFPYGQCLNTSQMLAKFYRDKGFDDVRVISGNKSTKPCSHAWIVVNGLIVDITADQFKDLNYPPVFVSEKSELHSQYEAKDNLWQSPDQNLVGTYCKILKQESL